MNEAYDITTRFGPPPPAVPKFTAAIYMGAKKPIKEKTHKQNFHGIIPGLGGGGQSVYVFFSPIGNDPKKTHKQLFGTHPVPGQSRTFVYFACFFLSLIAGVPKKTGLESAPLSAFLSACGAPGSERPRRPGSQVLTFFPRFSLAN